ncbi:hypothetical protein ACH5RR_024264 [Cinchona calisaya]|uniref:P-type ATPase A domain-containing protein n=1 Tax=Cinchona calisaya TaxID=153742 RepID=A0ABD2Z0C0_9GENT
MAIVLANGGEKNDGNAAATLMARLAPKAKVLGDGIWQELDVAILVPGDIISNKLGDIIPADARLLEVSSNWRIPACHQEDRWMKFTLVLHEIIVMFPVQYYSYRSGINNLLVLLFNWRIPIAIPTVLSVTLAIGSHHLSLQKDMDKDMVILLATRAARDAAIVNMLGDPKALANIKEVHFLPFSPVDKRTGITYVDADGNWYQASKRAPEQGLMLSCGCLPVPERSKESPGGPWVFCGLLPLFDPPRHNSSENICQALDLGVCVKVITEKGISWLLQRRQVDYLAWEQICILLPHFWVITGMKNEALPVKELIEKADGFAGVFPGDRLAIAEETGRRLGMGTNMYPSSSLLGRNRDENEALPVEELIEKADGFAGVFPDAARGAVDIVLTEPGLSDIISAIYAASIITIRIVLGFTRLALIWKYDFPAFMVLIIAILHDGTIMTISRDRVKSSPIPDSWKLNEILATGIVINTCFNHCTILLDCSQYLFLRGLGIVIKGISFAEFQFQTRFHLKFLSGNTEEISSAIYPASMLNIAVLLLLG